MMACIGEGNIGWGQGRGAWGLQECRRGSSILFFFFFLCGVIDTA
jgi:hypothetical protein